MKLNLGCGDRIMEGYLNVDIRPLKGVDVVGDIGILKDSKPNSVDMIYCSHVLEHFGRWEYMNALRRWYEILKPGGVLRLAVPDFTKICQHYSENNNIHLLMGLMYGGQDYEENHHKCIFDRVLLTESLKHVGFIQCRDWEDDWDDYSKAYLPHMDKTGLLMSLNIEAIKGEK